MIIGILLPLSNAYPGIGRDYLDGLTACLSQNEQEQNFTFIKENIGFGGSEKDAYAKAEKLLITDDADVLVAYVDEKVTNILYPLMQATGKLLIVVNPGANYPLSWKAQPAIIRLNLQQAFCCWLTGRLAAKSGNGSAALASTFYDCGYLHSAAMVKNFMDEGGTILHNYINSQTYDDNFEISPLIDFLSSTPDCENLLCVFDELPAALFYRLLRQYKSSNRLHLFVSPMMLQDKALTINESGFEFSINGYTVWDNGNDNAVNRNFINTCKRPVNLFSLLGWETAMVLQSISLLKNIDYSNAEEIVAALTAIEIKSPRGMLKLDVKTQQYIAQVAEFKLEQGLTASAIEPFKNIEEEWKAFTEIPTEGAVSGWTNTYLCY